MYTQCAAAIAVLLVALATISLSDYDSQHQRRLRVGQHPRYRFTGVRLPRQLVGA
jgi:hypothetical protein